MVEVLERLGYQADFNPAQTCCGQPAFNAGFHDQARAVAAHFLDVYEDSSAVIVPSGSCTSMITHHFADIFAGDARQLDRAQHLASRVFEFSQFLVEKADPAQLKSRFPFRVTYHDSCHALRELHLKNPPRQLLNAVQDLELVEMEAAEECCGFGGTFSVKFPEISGGMVRTKVDSILATGASHVVSLDSSCLMQLRGALERRGARVETLHLAEVLASQ